MICTIGYNCVLLLTLYLTCGIYCDNSFVVNIILAGGNDGNGTIIVEGCPMTLHCSYSIDLSVYSILWYRGSRLFYRYLPNNGNPSKQSFDDHLFSVDLKLSNATHVTLDNVSHSLSGEFSCEVTADEPFTTISGKSILSIYELWKVSKPKVGLIPNLAPSSELSVICSVPLIINNYTVHFYEDNKEIDSVLSWKIEKNVYVMRLKCNGLIRISCGVRICSTAEIYSDNIDLCLGSNGTMKLNRFVYLDFLLLSMVVLWTYS